MRRACEPGHYSGALRAGELPAGDLGSNPASAEHRARIPATSHSSHLQHEGADEMPAGVLSSSACKRERDSELCKSSQGRQRAEVTAPTKTM